MGDSLYGSTKEKQLDGFSHQMLHAHQLLFWHPITKKLIQIEAPIPEEMRELLQD